MSDQIKRSALSASLACVSSLMLALRTPSSSEAKQRKQIRKEATKQEKKRATKQNKGSPEAWVDCGKIDAVDKCRFIILPGLQTVK